MEGLRKWFGHGERHATLYTNITLYTSKSRVAMARVADRAPPPVIDTFMSNDISDVSRSGKNELMFYANAVFLLTALTKSIIVMPHV